MSTPIPPHPLALLRPRRERPCDSGAAKDRNELTPLHPLTPSPRIMGSL